MKNRDRSWFAEKVRELADALRRLPRPRRDAVLEDLEADQDPAVRRQAAGRLPDAPPATAMPDHRTLPESDDKIAAVVELVAALEQAARVGFTSSTEGEHSMPEKTLRAENLARAPRLSDVYETLFRITEVSPGGAIRVHCPGCGAVEIKPGGPRWPDPVFEHTDERCPVLLQARVASNAKHVRVAPKV